MCNIYKFRHRAINKDFETEKLILCNLVKMWVQQEESCTLCDFVSNYVLPLLVYNAVKHFTSFVCQECTSTNSHTYCYVLYSYNIHVGHMSSIIFSHTRLFTSQAIFYSNLEMSKDYTYKCSMYVTSLSYAC